MTGRLNGTTLTTVLSLVYLTVQQRGVSVVTQLAQFHERQPFRSRWVWILVIVSLTPVVGGTLWGVYQQLILGNPFGARPMSNEALLLTTAGSLAFAIAMVWLLCSCILTTRVDDTGVHLRFAPFHRREQHYPFKRIASATAISYRPIRDYGGWGLRFGPKGKAYNVSGNRGVLLTFTNEKTLLIGSLRAEELAQAIDARRPE